MDKVVLALGPGSGGPVVPAPPALPGLRRATCLRVVAEGPPGVVAVILAQVERAEDLDVASAYPGAAVRAWWVEERPQWDRRRAGAGGGLWRISFLHRAPGLSRRQFAEHWSGVHAPLAARHHPALRTYCQNVVVAPLGPDSEDLDGVAELGFASEQDLRQGMYDSPDGRRAVRSDVESFIDLSRSWRVLAIEEPLSL
jgi:uncharacterized protein (TIGR02118 family)